MAWTISDFFSLFYFACITVIVFKSVKWLLNYWQKVLKINKIPGLQMIPFIGNAHNLKTKHGNKLQKNRNLKQL